MSFSAITSKLRNFCLSGNPGDDQARYNLHRAYQRYAALSESQKTALNHFTVTERGTITGFNGAFVAPHFTAPDSGIRPTNVIYTTLDSALPPDGLPPGKAHSTHQTVHYENAHPVHTVSMRFSTFPHSYAIERIVASHVKSCLSDGSITAEFAEPLREQLRVDLLALRKYATSHGEKQGPVEFACRYQLVPGSATGSNSRQSVPLPIWQALVRDGHTPVHFYQPCLDTALNAFAAMPELVEACRNGTVTSDFALRCLREHRDEEAVSRLLNSGGALPSLVKDFIDTSKATHRRLESRLLAMNGVPAAKAFRHLSPRKPNTFDEYQSHVQHTVRHGSSLEALMFRAKDWKPTSSQAINAYRYALIMAEYDRLLDRSGLALGESDADGVSDIDYDRNTDTDTDTEFNSESGSDLQTSHHLAVLPQIFVETSGNVRTTRF